MTNTPKAVSNAAKEADDMILSLQNTGKEAAAAADADKTALSGEEHLKPTETPHATEASANLKPEQNTDQEKSKTPDADADKGWAERYKILQGKYNAEVPRLQEQIKQLKTQLDQATPNYEEVGQLKAELAALKQQLQGKSPSQPEANAPDLDGLRKVYGDELVNGLYGVMKSMLAPLQQSVEKVTGDVNSFNERNHQNENDRLKSSLRDILKPQGIDLDQVNSDPLFIDWLKEPADELYGQSRQPAFSQALSSGDLNRVARFFTDFVKSHSQSQATSKPNLSEHVTRQPSSASEPEGDSIVWTPERIDALYANEKNMDPAEFARLEKQLFKAVGS